MRHVKGDATSAEDLTALGIGGYDSVVVLQDGSGFVDLEAEVSAEQGARDSHSLACLLAVEEALEASGTTLFLVLTVSMRGSGWLSVLGGETLQKSRRLWILLESGEV